MGSGASKPNEPVATAVPTAATAEVEAPSVKPTPAEEPSALERAKTTVMDAVDKVVPKDPHTSAISGLVTADTDITFNVSTPTNAAEAALLCVNLIVTLIKAHRARSEFLRAMSNRVDAIVASVTELSRRDLSSALAPLQNLVATLDDFRRFVAYVTTKPSNFFESAVSFFRAKSDIDNLAQFDALITRALADLQVPLQAEQLRAMDEQRSTLRDIDAKLSALIKVVQENKNVLPLAKRTLTNETAALFWFETFPAEYSVPLQKFATSLRAWFTDVKGLVLTKKQADRLLKIINTGVITTDEVEAPDDHIDARECNKMFKSLPDDWTKRPFDEVLNELQIVYDMTQKAEMKAMRERLLEMRNRQTRADSRVAPAEAAMLAANADHVYVRFLCTATETVDGASTTALRAHAFYLFHDGTFYVAGRTAADDEFLWNGTAYGGFGFEINFNGGDFLPARSDAEEQTAAGVYRGNTFTCSMIHNVDQQLHTYTMILGLQPFGGFYEYGSAYESEYTGRKDNMFMRLSIVDNRVVGLSDDDVGPAIWNGEVAVDGKVELSKAYLSAHIVRYRGQLTRDANDKIKISGTWALDDDGEVNGPFMLWEL